MKQPLVSLASVRVFRGLKFNQSPFRRRRRNQQAGSLCSPELFPGGNQFLETLVFALWLKHWIQPDQRRSERRVRGGNSRSAVGVIFSIAPSWQCRPFRKESPGDGAPRVTSFRSQSAAARQRLG